MLDTRALSKLLLSEGMDLVDAHHLLSVVASMGNAFHSSNISFRLAS